MTKCFFDNTKLATENISICSFSATSILVVRNADFLIITGGWKNFLFQNEKFLGFVHPYNLLEYFKNKDIDLNKIL